MLTISIFLEALTNPQKMNISQNKLKKAFNTSTSTINAWIRKDTQPNLTAADIFKSIDSCRTESTNYQNTSVFIEEIINSLDISFPEKQYVDAQYNEYKNTYSSDEALCYQKFLTHLIQLALNKSELRTDLSYDPKNHARPVVGIGNEHIIAAAEDGRVFSSGVNDYQQCNTHAWRDVVSVSAGWRSSIGLKSDGTCIATGYDTVGNGEMFHWNNLSSVCCGTYHFLGLRTDGLVTAYGPGGDGQCEVSDWRNVKALAAGTGHSVGLLRDGTVIACGRNVEGQCDVSDWRNVIQISAAGNHTIGLTENGEILLAGDQKHVFDFSGWTNIVSVATGFFHVAGLKEDGSVLYTGHENRGLLRAYKWWDIIAVFAGFFATAGVTSDGSILVTNDEHNKIHLNTLSWNIYSDRKTKDGKESPFEISRKKILSTLEEIYDAVLKLSPSLHESVLDSDSIILLENIRAMSKEIWIYREKIIQIRPLERLILNYNSAFADFYLMFSIDMESNQYSPLDQAYDVCMEFLTAIRQVMMELRSF